MILVDTSVWVDHLRSANEVLSGALERLEVLGHPWVIGEVALGNVGRGATVSRDEVLICLGQLPLAPLATSDEQRLVIERHGLAGSGIGWVDTQLVASTLLAPGARLWTRDRRLHAVAARLGIAQPLGG